MIDSDDVGNAALFGGVVVFVIFLVVYLVWSRPEIKACHEKGGEIVRIGVEDKCVDTSALKELK